MLDKETWHLSFCLAALCNCFLYLFLPLQPSAASFPISNKYYINTKENGCLELIKYLFFIICGRRYFHDAHILIIISNCEYYYFFIIRFDVSYFVQFVPFGLVKKMLVIVWDMIWGNSSSFSVFFTSIDYFAIFKRPSRLHDLIDSISMGLAEECKYGQRTAFASMFKTSPDLATSSLLH